MYYHAQAASMAWGLRESFQRSDGNVHTVPSELVKLVGQLKEACRGRILLDENERLGITFNLVIAMAPYLAPGELQPMWGTLNSGVCASQATQRERAWRSLFKAVEDRNPHAMFTLAARLLASEIDVPLQARKYLLASAMTGALAQGKRSESRELWEKYGGMIFESAEQDMLFRLLNTASSE
jgi:hypothetical protein